MELSRFFGREQALLLLNCRVDLATSTLFDALDPLVELLSHWIQVEVSHRFRQEVGVCRIQKGVLLHGHDFLDDQDLTLNLFLIRELNHGKAPQLVDFLFAEHPTQLLLRNVE